MSLTWKLDLDCFVQEGMMCNGLCSKISGKSFAKHGGRECKDMVAEMARKLAVGVPGFILGDGSTYRQ